MRAPSRVWSRAAFTMAMATVSVAFASAASMAAVVISDVPVPIPSTIADPAQTTADTVDRHATAQPVPDLGTGELDERVTDLITGADGGGQPATEPTPPEREPGSGPGPREDPSTRSSEKGAEGVRADIQDAQRTATRLPPESSSSIDRAVRLAGPFAPAVIIAALGLLALAAAARGNDRLIKHEADGTSGAGAWRL